MGEFVWDSYKTLNKCRETMVRQITGAYLRFGDGDFYLREGHNDMLQQGNPNIAHEMKEAFSLSGEGIIKCLPLHSNKFGCMPEMKPNVHKQDDGFAQWVLERSEEYFQNETIYSPVALHYLGAYDKGFTVDFLRFLRKQRPIFVGNENIPADIVDKLFGSATHIKTPPHNCYPQLDRIENETANELEKHPNDFQVVVLAMGTSGRMLIKRILNKQKYSVFIFDFGSLMDALCGWNSRAWIGLAEVSSAYWNEMLNEIAKS